jgi:hypothetical protein
MVKGWLGKRVRLDLVEARDIVRFKEMNEKNRILGRNVTPVPERPGGFKHEAWLKFRAQYQAGDELRIFCSPKDTWNELAGRAGYAIVRDGEVVDIFVSVMS